MANIATTSPQDDPEIIKNDINSTTKWCSRVSEVRICTHTYIHTYIRAFVQKYIDTCTRTRYMPTSIAECLHSCLHTCCFPHMQASKTPGYLRRGRRTGRGESEGRQLHNPFARDQRRLSVGICLCRGDEHRCF